MSSVPNTMIRAIRASTTIAAKGILCTILGGLALATYDAHAKPEAAASKPGAIQDIKSYCLDFNWAKKGGFAKPGDWNAADPAEFVAWHEQIGANCVQTFCVSCNGYAWYKGGPVPEQPGLKHDFLREVVKLGHAKGMLVMGYFCAGANTRWGEEHPDLSYGTPSKCHIPYTDEYLAYLESAVSDAVKTTGIDGFMVDWLWQPKRDANGGKWLDAEKKLYEQLMGEPFPGEEKLTEAQEAAYGRKAIARCWTTIHKAAKSANPNVVIWLTVNDMTHEHVVNSEMYREVDWLMAEAGRMDHIDEVRSMVGSDTRMITCLAAWNGQDPFRAVPEALRNHVGLYGFARPLTGKGTYPLEKILESQVSELTGDAKNIAALARAYHGMSAHSVWKDGRFEEPANAPPFVVSHRTRGRGAPDRSRVDVDGSTTVVTVTTPYHMGRAFLRRTGEAWPATIVIRLTKVQGGSKPVPPVGIFRMANGSVACATSIDGAGSVQFGGMEGGLDNRAWGADFAVSAAPANQASPNIAVTQAADYVEITVPAVMTESNPETIAFEWAHSVDEKIK